MTLFHKNEIKTKFSSNEQKQNFSDQPVSKPLIFWLIRNHALLAKIFHYFLTRRIQKYIRIFCSKKIFQPPILTKTCKQLSIQMPER